MSNTPASETPVGLPQYPPYAFTYRRRGSLFKKTIKNVFHHVYLAETDKMTILFPEGGMREICNWKDCEVFLGVDWELHAKLVDRDILSVARNRDFKLVPPSKPGK